MKTKISLILLLFAAMLLIPACKADFTPGNVNIYLWVDKTQYKPGDTITLYFTIFNDKSSEIVINEVNVTAPWFMYIKDQWEGSQTIAINKVVHAGEAYYNFTTLAVPNDGRAFFTSSYAQITVTIKIDNALNPRTIRVGIANPPVQTSVREIDTVILLMAVLIILIVVCTALIAAAIFLSARKPQETYAQASSQS